MGHIDENCKKLLLLGEDNGYREWSQDLRADPRNPTTTEDAKYLRDSDHGGSDDNFNDLVSNDDKLGKNDHPNWLIHGFHEVISYGNLHDLPIDGYKYTWAHMKGKPNGIEELVEP
ncbi:hypothetical protein JHK85_044372 [Glycine max]|nr:hypothetical protein JHK85_044372 [Glycine max]